MLSLRRGKAWNFLPAVLEVKQLESFVVNNLMFMEKAVE